MVPIQLHCHCANLSLSQPANPQTLIRYDA